MTIPTPAQVGTLLTVAPEEHRAFVALCAFAGLRLGEAAALQLRDIDNLNATITITRQVQRRTGGGHEISPPKNGSERVVPLAPALADMLDQQIRRLNPTRDEQWLFGLDGAPASQNSVNYWWRKARRDAGLPDARLHDLRHFYASGLIATGCDIVTVQRALGHARATTTLNTYAHVWTTSQGKARNAAQLIIHSTLVAGDSASSSRESGPGVREGARRAKELR